MKNNKYFRVVALTLVVGVALAVCRLLRTIIPWGVLPQMNIPNMTLLSLIALVLDHYLVPGEKDWKIGFLPLSALVFGLLPFASGFAGAGEALKLAVVGGAVFALIFAPFKSTGFRRNISSGSGRNPGKFHPAAATVKGGTFDFGDADGCVRYKAAAVSSGLFPRIVDIARPDRCQIGYIAFSGVAGQQPYADAAQNIVAVDGKIRGIDKL